MSGPLDELREQLADLREHVIWDDDATFNRGVDASIATLDAFAAAHPGLVDNTMACDGCGRFIAPAEGIGWAHASASHPEDTGNWCDECLPWRAKKGLKP